MFRTLATVIYAAFFFLAVGLWAAILVQAADGAAWYAELKTWQTGVGALLGLGAILAGALWNARLNRRRDTRLRRQEIRGLCLAFAAELFESAKKLRSTAGSVDLAIKNKEPLKIENFRDHYNPVTDIYQANLGKIGLFGELARDVVVVYEDLAIARGDTRVAEKQYFNSAGLLDPTGTNVELLWLAPAKKAEAVAQRLETYDPPPTTDTPITSPRCRN